MLYSRSRLWFKSTFSQAQRDGLEVSSQDPQNLFYWLLNFS